MALHPTRSGPVALATGIGQRLGISRWFDLLPEVVLTAGLVFFLVDETSAATSSFRSGRAILVMGGLVVGWLIARLVLARVVPWTAARQGVLGAAALGILALIVLPAYVNETVVERFPGSQRPATAAPPAVDRPTDGAGGEDGTSATEPVAIATGSFEGIDHRAAGTVRIYRQPDGTFVVGLEDIDIQPGPDYDVYVVPGAGREDPGDQAVRLDDLKGNKGTQFYPVPPGTDLEDREWTVLVWCVTFGVPVANATPV